MARDPRPEHDDRDGRDAANRRDTNERSATAGSRDRHRDNDDVRDPTSPDDRLGTAPDTKHEARGDARENVGDTARDQVGRSENL